MKSDNLNSNNMLAPLNEPFSSEVSAILDHYPKQNGYLLKLFRVFANSVRFLHKGVANLLDKESPISMQQRELVILRICANNNCEYEWGVHVAIFSKYAKLSADQVAATRLQDHSASCWDEVQSLLIKSVDELCRHGGISAETYRQFSALWSVEQQLEILALAGNYHTICFVANTARLEGESFAESFPGLLKAASLSKSE